MADRDPQKQPGFAVGKRVWLANTWDGALLGHRYGERTKNMTVAAVTDLGIGVVDVLLGDGTVVRIDKAHLRLSPPTALSGKNEKTKPARPAVRKEAIDPIFGTELTIFDALEEA